MRINRAEVCGPVASVIRVKDYDEALAVANDTPFGLCSGIVPTSPKHAPPFNGHSGGGMVRGGRRVRSVGVGGNGDPRRRGGRGSGIGARVTAGKPGMKTRSDKWTAVTEDGSYSAHFEHVVAVTSNGPWVLTRP